MFARALTLTLIATPAFAGTVILENGQVVVGKIKQEEANEDSVTVRWPYKDFAPPMAEDGENRGEWVIPMHKVRWMDVQADGPTEAYWAEFGELEIGDDYKAAQQRWKMRQEEGDVDEVPGDQVDSDAAGLITGDGDEQAETPAETPADAPAEAPADAPAETPADAPAETPAADAGGGGFCALQPGGAAPRSGAAWLALLAGGLLTLRRRGA